MKSCYKIKYEEIIPSPLLCTVKCSDLDTINSIASHGTLYIAGLESQSSHITSEWRHVSKMSPKIILFVNGNIFNHNNYLAGLDRFEDF